MRGLRGRQRRVARTQRKMEYWIIEVYDTKGLYDEILCVKILQWRCITSTIPYVISCKDHDEWRGHINNDDDDDG